MSMPVSVQHVFPTMHRYLLVIALATGLVLSGCSVTGPSLENAEPAGEVDIPSSRVVHPFSVSAADGSAYAHPFLGGLNVPRPQLVDIDGDEDPDLFVQEYTGSVMFLENVGQGGEPEYVWRSDKYRNLDIGEWYRFADLDLDGDFDLLAEEPFSHIRYYENVGTETDPTFELVADTLRDVDGKPVFSDRQNIPNAVDIDCDAAVDLFIGKLDGTITRYETVETEPVPVFELVTERFEDIEIVAQFGQPGNANPTPMPNIPNRSVPEGGPSAGPAPTAGGGTEARHGANTMTFGDIDGDGDYDLFWGDFFEPSLLQIENTGSCQNPVLRGEPEPFPPPEPIESSGYNAPTFGDVDSDGDMDLLIGVLGGAFNPNRTAASNLYFYEQISEDRFELRTRRFLDQIDVGSESFPAFADLDGDGDDDLLVANKISATDSRTSVLLHMENTGTGLQVRDSLELLTAYHYAPALADLDGDGDLDMLLGTWNDGVAYYRNDGSPSEARFELVEKGFVELTRGSHSTPALVDIDDDGDLDLFIGETSGTINFYDNVGSARQPEFELVSDEYQGIDIGRRSVPAFRDVDRDKDFDLVVGTETDGLLLFRNEGDPSEARFERVGPLPVHAPSTVVPAFGDPDGDGSTELVIGGFGGGLFYFESE